MHLHTCPYTGGHDVHCTCMHSRILTHPTIATYMHIIHMHILKKFCRLGTCSAWHTSHFLHQYCTYRKVHNSLHVLPPSENNEPYFNWKSVQLNTQSCLHTNQTGAQCQSVRERRVPISLWQLCCLRHHSDCCTDPPIDHCTIEMNR